MRVAFFHALWARSEVIPPYAVVALCRRSCMALERRASAGATAAPAGRASVHVVPTTFHHDTYGFSTTCRGDDFLAEGSTIALDRLVRVLGEAFDVKVLPRIGPSGFGGQSL